MTDHAVISIIRNRVRWLLLGTYTVSQWTDSKSECRWVQNFHMSRSTFEFICEQLKSMLLRKNTKMRNCISVEKRVAICIWHLASGNWGRPELVMLAF